MPRSALIGMLAVIAVGAAVLVAAASKAQRGDQLNIWVPAAKPLADLRRGDEVCQQPIGIDHSIRKVAFVPGPAGRRAPQLRVRITEASSPAQELTSATVPSHVMSGAPRIVALTGSVENHLVGVCVASLGHRPVTLFGDLERSRGADQRPNDVAINPTLSSSAAFRNGRRLNGDLALFFPAPESRSLLSLVPRMMERASQFKGAGVDTGLLWALFAGALVGAPLALSAAMRSARA